MIQKLFFRIISYINYRCKAVNAHGLHSPFLFDFYNEVIDAKKEYYYFKRFRAVLPQYKQFISEGNALFLYRWASFYKPDSVMVKEPNLPVVLALSIPSSHKSISVDSLDNYSEEEKKILSSEGILIQENIPAEMIYCMELNEQSKALFCDYRCVIIQKPHQNKVKEEFWNKLCTSKEVSISIDLFQFGILLFDKNQAKQHFVVKYS